MAKFVVDARLPIHERAFECGALNLYAKSVHCRSDIQILNERFLMDSSKRNWSREAKGFAEVSHD
jgi:hypothetical protein